MSFNHPVSDLTARIRNGYLARRDTIESPVSKLRENILKILKDEGFILNYSKNNNEKGFETLKIHLKYHNDEPVVSDIKSVSKPGRRIYTKYNEIPVANNGLGVVLISTSGGVITDQDARDRKLGGEILLTIF